MTQQVTERLRELIVKLERHLDTALDEGEISAEFRSGAYYVFHELEAALAASEPTEYPHLAICNGDRHLGREVAPATVSLSEEQVREVLGKHWLVAVDCHHAANPDEESWDRAICACSQIAFPKKPTVGEAVGTWIEHVLEMARPQPAGVRKEGER